MTQTFIYTYQTICDANGKSYIGVHKTGNLNDGYIGCGIFKQSDAWRKGVFHRAVRKYGYSSFRRYILNFYDTYDEALLEEKFLVNKMWVKDLSNYNCAIGGNGGAIYWMGDDEEKSHYAKIADKRRGVKRSKETCEKISRAKKGVPLSDNHKKALSNNSAKYWEGKKLTDEIKAKLSEWRTGKKMSDAHREILSKSHIGLPSHSKKAVLQYTMSGVFVKEYESLTVAGVENKCLRTSISNNLKGLSKHCNGFIFKYKKIVA